MVNTTQLQKLRRFLPLMWNKEGSCLYQELQEMHMNGEITLDEETEFQTQREAEYVEAKKQELVDALPGCSISFVR